MDGGAVGTSKFLERNTHHFGKSDEETTWNKMFHVFIWDSAALNEPAELPFGCLCGSATNSRNLQGS